MKIIQSLAIIGITIAFSPFVQAGGDYFGVQANQNLVFTAHRFNQENISSFDLDLAEYKDSNDDGDFGDANERTLHIDLNAATDCTAVAANPHLACGIFTNTVVILWKRGSTLQLNGTNFSLSIAMHTSPIDVIHRMGFSTTFLNETFCQAECRANISANVSERLVANLTIQLTQTEDRSMENSSTFFNRTVQNISLHANRTIQNVTVQVDQNLTQLEGNLSIIDTDGFRKVINHTLNYDRANQDQTANKTVANLTIPLTITVESGAADEGLSSLTRFFLLVAGAVILGLLGIRGNALAAMLAQACASAVIVFILADNSVVPGNATLLNLVILIYALVVGVSFIGYKNYRGILGD